MSIKEAPRPGLIRAALAGKVTVREVAQVLGLSRRQVQRLKKSFRREGVRGLLHHSRGRPSPLRMPETIRQQAARLMQTTYQGFSDCHLTEKLREIEGLDLCRESVRRIREALKIPPQRRRRSPKHHHRRLPEGREGAMVQIDGSPHDWLQGRGPQMCLLGGVDDATSRFTGLIFRPSEDLHGYAAIFQQTFTRYGLPVSFYGDQTSVLVRNDDHWSIEEQLQGFQNPTHLGRALKELGIAYIAAHCPQGKGRVENRWGTLQDRLVSELRLHHINSLQAANVYLPTFLEDFDRRFAHAAREPQSAYRACSVRQIELALCCRYQRTVAHDNTTKVGSRWIQIPPSHSRRSYAGCRVELRELLDGRMLVFHQNRLIASQPAPQGPFSLAPRLSPGSKQVGRTAANGSATPGPSRKAQRKTDEQPPKALPPRAAANHPWRKRLLPAPTTTQQGG